MAILAMKRVSIYGLKADSKPILEKIQRAGVVEIQDFVEEDEVFKKVKMPISASEFERNIRDAEAALEILNTYKEEKSGLLSSFKGRDVIEEEDYDTFYKKLAEAKKFVNRILELSRDINEKNGEILRASQQLDMLVPWESFDLALNSTGTEKTAIFIGALPGEQTLETIAAGFPEDLLVDVEIISKDKNQTCIMAVTLKEDKEQVSSALRAMGFAYPALVVPYTPIEYKERLLAEIERYKEEIAKEEEEIISYNDKRPEIKFMADYQSIRAEKYEVASSLPQSDHTFVLSGYVPEINVKDLEKTLEPYSVIIETEDVGEKEDSPVALKNNAFSSSVQGVVESYALPAKGEIDPSFLISLFYFIFFGFMLSDAAIGILIFVGAGVLLLKNKNMEHGLRNNVKLFMCGGLSAIFFGVLFGSYFGDFFQTVSSFFFGKPLVVKPLWLDMASNPMTALTLALIMGIIHIFTGLGANGYQLLKRKKVADFIFDVVVWYVVIGGLLVKCLSMQMIMDILAGGATPPFSAEIGNIGLYATAAGAVVILFMGGRSSKNWGKRLLKGAYALYGITGYLSDVLSYSRLLALGLATGVISSVANMIGTMFGKGFVGIVIFILVFLIINAVNIGINTLGAYVHTNRLQYVEFFGRFYEGGGRPFEPYSIKTKYYKFKEK